MKKPAFILLLLTTLSCESAPKPDRAEPVPSSDRRPLVASDLFRMKEVVEIDVASTGDIAHTLRSFDVQGDRYDRQIWVENNQITFESGGASAPAWSPDGALLACVMSSDGKPQVWTMDRDGNGRKAVTDVPRGASSPVWSPDGKRIAFLSRARPGDKQLPHIIEEVRPPDPRIITEPTYRREGRYLTDTESQIFVVDLDSGRSTQLTSGRFGASRPSWSPDGKHLVFSSNRAEPKFLANNSELYVVSVDGGDEKRITDNPGPDYSPAWSPDGKWIACVGRPKRDWGVWQSDLWILPPEGGKPRNLTEKHDRTILGGPIWSNDGAVIYFRSPDQGSEAVFEIVVATGSIRRIAPTRGQISAFDVHRNGMLVGILTTPHSPAEVWVFDGETSRQTQVTSHNARWLSEVWLAPQEEITYDSDEFKIQAWYQPPFQQKFGEKVPLIVEIHGGPAWYYGWRWFFELQLLSSAGYAVLYTNPRGSTGYGEKFHKANEKDWGGGDYRDIMAGVDAILDMYPDLDRNNLGVTGGSYGGYMTNWVIGHTDRFKAAVSQRCVSNLVSFLNSDIHMWLSQSYFDTTPWEGFELLWKHSPLAHVKNVKTPLRLIHSEGDYRTPINQAEEFFVAMKAIGRAEVDFVRYPLPEGHNLSRSGTPSRRKDRLERILEWFDRHLVKGSQR